MLYWKAENRSQLESKIKRTIKKIQQNEPEIKFLKSFLLTSIRKLNMLKPTDSKTFITDYYCKIYPMRIPKCQFASILVNKHPRY